MAEETTPEIDPRLTTSIPWIMRNGVGIQIMETLAVGAFLTAFAVQLGASNFTIGLLAAVPHLSQLAQIPALAVVERYRDRSRIYFISGLVARPAMLFIGAAALIPNHEVALGVIVFAFALRCAMGAFLGCAWGSWMRDLIPDRMMGEIFGARQKRMTLHRRGAEPRCRGLRRCVEQVGTASANVQLLGDLHARVLRWVLWRVVRTARVRTTDDRGTRGSALVSRARRAVPEPELPASADVPRKLELRRQPGRTVLHRAHAETDGTEPRADRWPRHAQPDGGLPDGFAVGAIADRFSNKSVLSVCASLFIVCIFAWTFTMFPNRHVLTIPLLIAIHIATGVASAGVTLASGNVRPPSSTSRDYETASAPTPTRREQK